MCSVAPGVSTPPPCAGFCELLEVNVAACFEGWPRAIGGSLGGGCISYVFSSLVSIHAGEVRVGVEEGGRRFTHGLMRLPGKVCRVVVRAKLSRESSS